MPTAYQHYFQNLLAIIFGLSLHQAWWEELPANCATMWTNCANESDGKFELQWILYTSLLWGLKWEMSSRMFSLRSHFCGSFLLQLQNTNLKYSTLWLSEKYSKYKLKKFLKDEKYYKCSIYHFQDIPNVHDKWQRRDITKKLIIWNISEQFSNFYWCML